ncbi:MAG: nucleotide exchange factor GrpE [Prevotella sp.]|nr:nucleotide exchange factor GrpE [Prevotella sp.]
MDEKDIQQENGAEQEPLNEEQAEAQNAENTEGEVFEAEDAETEAKAEETVEAKDPLTAAQEAAAEWEKKYLYKCAEMENLRKRTIKEKAELILNGGEKTVKAILPVIDDMERALANSENADAATLKEGMELIYKKFLKTLEGLGVNPIDTTDKDFDVNFHEAIAMVPGMGDDKKGKVIDCTEKGYTLNDKVIRYAKVAVGQ